MHRSEGTSAETETEQGCKHAGSKEPTANSQRLMLGRKAKEGIRGRDRCMMETRALYHTDPSIHTVYRKITLVQCRQSYIRYSSGFVISTSAIAQGGAEGIMASYISLCPTKTWCHR